MNPVTTSSPQFKAAAAAAAAGIGAESVWVFTLAAAAAAASTRDSRFEREGIQYALCVGEWDAPKTRKKKSHPATRSPPPISAALRSMCL